MKKISVVVLMLLMLLLVGFSKKNPLPLEGMYSVKSKTMTIFDFDALKSLELTSSFAELTESKPESITVGFDYEKLSEPRFGSFKLGNNDRKIWFVMGKSKDGYWTDFYIDQNLDYIINETEKVKGFHTYDNSEKGIKAQVSMMLIPIPLRISYKGLTTEYEKKVYYYFIPAGYESKSESEVIVQALTGSFLEGELKVTVGKDNKIAKFRILDGDSNGCYNDFGKDYILIDGNYDGEFKKNEIIKLTEFYDYTGPDKLKKQLRMIILAHPAKIAVAEAAQDIDRTPLEPVSDPAEESEPVKTEPAKDTATPPATDTQQPKQ